MTIVSRGGGGAPRPVPGGGAGPRLECGPDPVVDVRQDPDVRATMDGFVEEHGGIDLLVNNAAGNFVCPAERLSQFGGARSSEDRPGRDLLLQV